MTEHAWRPIAAQILLALFLVILIPLAFHLPGPERHNLPELIAWSLAITSAGMMIFLAASRRPRLMELSFWMFVYVFFGVAAVAQISAHHYPLSTGAYSESQLLATQLRVVVGIVAFVGGISLWRLRPRDDSSPLLSERFEVHERRLQMVGVVGAAIAALLVAKTGITHFFESRDALSIALYNAAGKVQGLRVYDLASKTTGGLKQFFLNVPILVALVYLVVTKLWRRHLLLTVVLVAMNLITNNFISNARYWTGVVVAGLLAACIDLSKRRRHTYFVLGLLLTTVFGLSYLNIFRTTAAEGALAPPPRSQQLVVSPDYGMFQQELNGTLYVQSHGFTGGRQLAGALLVYVPRSLWPSKPGATGQLVEQEVGVNTLNSSSVWTEFYIDFGFPELVLCFVLLGCLYARLDDVFERSTSLATRVIIPISATYSILFLRGSLQPSIAFGVPIFVVLLFCLHRRPQVTGDTVVPGSADRARPMGLKIPPMADIGVRPMAFGSGTVPNPSEGSPSRAATTLSANRLRLTGRRPAGRSRASSDPPVLRGLGRIRPPAPGGD
jgi:hypothetical protein